LPEWLPSARGYFEVERQQAVEQEQDLAADLEPAGIDSASHMK